MYNLYSEIHINPPYRQFRNLFPEQEEIVHQLEFCLLQLHSSILREPEALQKKTMAVLWTMGNYQSFESKIRFFQSQKMQYVLYGALLIIGVFFLTTIIFANFYGASHVKEKESIRLNSQILAAQEETLAFFSHELHDTVAQDLRSLEYLVEDLRSIVPQESTFINILDKSKFLLKKKHH